MLIQYVDKEFSLEYNITINVNFFSKEIQKNENKIRLQIWDTAGEERFKSITKTFYRNSAGCILVFDLTSPQSFEDVEFWRKEFLDEIDSNEREQFPFVLLGNKNDLKDSIEVKDEDIQKYCNEHNNMPYFSVSAKTGENVEKAFIKITDLAFEKNKNIELPEIEPAQITTKPKPCIC